MKTIAGPVTVMSAVSFASDINITLPELFDYYGISFIFTFSAANSIAGSLTMQVSNDNTNWATYTDLTAITTFTVPVLWKIDNKIFPFKYARLAFDNTSGTGTASATFAACRL